MLLSSSILLLLARLKVAVPVNLDGELQCWTVEVNHIGTDTELPPKFPAADLAALQLRPQNEFSRRQSVAQQLACWLLRLTIEDLGHNRPPAAVIAGKLSQSFHSLGKGDKLVESRYPLAVFDCLALVTRHWSLVTVLPQFPVEPGLRQTPFAHDCAWRQLQRLGGLFHGQSTKKT